MKKVTPIKPLKYFAIFTDGQHLGDMELEARDEEEAYEMAFEWYSDSLSSGALRMLSAEEITEEEYEENAEVKPG